MTLLSRVILILSFIFTPTLTAQNWEVIEPSMMCKPVAVFRKDGCDSLDNGEWANIFEGKGFISSAFKNNCFATIWDHIKAVDGRVYNSILVHMDQFGDMAIARRLVEIAQAGAKVKILLNSYKGTLEKFCGKMVFAYLKEEEAKLKQAAQSQKQRLKVKADGFRQEQTKIKEQLKEATQNEKEALEVQLEVIKANLEKVKVKIAQICEDCLMVTPQDPKIKLHQKFLRVRHEQGGQTHDYILNGSYNFTVMAWRDKAEALTVLHRAADVAVAGEDWQVEEPYLTCLGKDNTSRRMFSNPVITSPGVNECYRYIMRLFDLNDPNRTYTSVKVSMGYFEDNTIAQAIAAVGHKFPGVVTVKGDVSQLEKASTSQATKNAITTVQATLKDVNATWYTKGGFTKEFKVSGDFCEYHPKWVKVVYTQKEADGETYQYEYLLNGSYNFTPSAKTFNQEAITVLRKKIHIPDAKPKAKPKATVAVVNPEDLPLGKMAIGDKGTASKSTAKQAPSAIKKVQATNVSKANEQMPTMEWEETWSHFNKTSTSEPWEWGLPSFTEGGRVMVVALFMTMTVGSMGS